MCTVTYIPAGKGFYLTSNRDESSKRLPATKPQLYYTNCINLIYPKDNTASGTWIAVKENGDALCLLNGAFEAHIPIPPYHRSRGLIVLDLALQNKIADAFNSIDLYQVEPFTLIIAEQHKLYECRWDGSQKFFMQISESQSHIWSSSTLYPLPTRLCRKSWFDDWLKLMNKQLSFTNIFNFHMKTGDGDKRNNLVMNRNNLLFTVSVTGIYVDEATINMQYFDLLKNDITNITFKKQLQNCSK